MSQHASDANNGHSPASQANEPKPTDAKGIEAQVTDDVGGVQGTDPDEADALPSAAGSTTPRSSSQEPAPDAGEIEWAGQVVKKPPTPAA